MNRFEIDALPLLGLKKVTRKRLSDDRGYLERLFCIDELTSAGWYKPIVQINHTHTAKQGTVRGMHYQEQPYAETKLVTCIQGAVWDVAIDLRKHSPTFLKWHAEELSAENRVALLIPTGFAHGFQTLTDHVTMLYCHDAPYHSPAEKGLHPLDPMLKIHWPQPIKAISDRDIRHPLISSTQSGV